MPDLDESLAMVQRGQSARIIRGDTEALLIDRETDIITGLIGAYNIGELTNDHLRGSIGEIAALRWFRLQLESSIRQGVMAAEAALGDENAQEG